MKTKLFFLSISLMVICSTLLAQTSNVSELSFNDTYCNNKMEEQHFASEEYVTLQAPKIHLQVTTKSKTKQYGTLVIDLDRNNKIEQREILSKPIAADAKGRFDFSIEIPEEIWEQIKNTSTETLTVQFRVAATAEMLYAPRLLDKRLSSILLSLEAPSIFIKELIINKTIVKNEKAAQHAISDEIVIIDGDFVTLNVATNATNQEKLYGTLVIDLNGNGRIEQEEILSAPFLANENGVFRNEIKLNKEVIEVLNQLKEPIPIQFRVSENPEALSSPATNQPDFSSLLFRAIGPVIVVDTSQGDQHPGGEECLFPRDTTIIIGVSNQYGKKMKINNISTPAIPDLPTSINPTLPNYIPHLQSENFALNYSNAISNYFPVDITDPCFKLPISIEYVIIQNILHDYDSTTETEFWDTTFSAPYLYVDSLELCYCETGKFRENGATDSRSKVINNNNSVNKITGWKVFPNPLVDELTINYHLTQTSEVTLLVSNMNGQVVKSIQQNTLRDAGEYQQRILLTNLQQGVYVVSLTTNAGTQFKKVFKTE